MPDVLIVAALLTMCAGALVALAVLLWSEWVHRHDIEWDGGGCSDPDHHHPVIDPGGWDGPATHGRCDRGWPGP